MANIAPGPTPATRVTIATAATGRLYATPWSGASSRELATTVSDAPSAARA